MLASATAPKVYHAHIPKTAGTSLNSWLEDSVDFERAKPDTFDGELVRWLKARGILGFQSAKVVSASCWDIYDVIHGHRNLLPGRTPGSIVLTVLREPVARSTSLYFDLAALTEKDIAHLSGPTLSYRRDCLTMTFSELRKKWAHSNLFLGQHMDYMCRFFLRNDVPNNTFYQMSGKERFKLALNCFERDITAFGFTEEIQKTTLHFSELLGLFPLASLPRYNLGRPKRSEITAEDREYLNSITSGDKLLFEHLRKQFSAVDVSYSVEKFEALHLQDAGRRISLKQRGGDFVYNMNAPLIGDGFWGRDSAGTSECRRWSGPGNVATVYIPSVSNAPVEIDIKIAGWSDRGARNSFSVKAWNEPVTYRAVSEAGYADSIRFVATPRDGILKLEFQSIPRNLQPNDWRRKGFSLSKIVQRLI